MTRSQSNKLSMYLAVIGTVQEYPGDFPIVPAFAKCFANFQDIIDQIKLTRQVQEDNIKGYHERKSQIRAKLVEKLFEIANSTFAYAVEEDDAVLRNIVDVAARNTGRMRETTLHSLCCNVYNAANAVVASLGDYDVDATELADFLSMINTWHSVIDDPRVAITERSTSTLHLVELFDQADLKLRQQLDKLMSQYRDKNVTFFVHYFEARQIIDRGGRRTKQAETSTEEEASEEEATENPTQVLIPAEETLDNTQDPDGNSSSIEQTSS